jgi:putative ABC transport system permease protein
VFVGLALWSAFTGYANAFAIASGLVHAAGGSNVSLLLPPGLAALLFVLTLTMCAGGAAISLRRVARISPISVFR